MSDQLSPEDRAKRRAALTREHRRQIRELQTALARLRSAFDDALRRERDLRAVSRSQQGQLDTARRAVQGTVEVKGLRVVIALLGLIGGLLLALNFAKQ